jgi:uncharacterized RDD family membrane protein YckC
VIFRRKQRPSPCPNCDAELNPEKVQDDKCPECGQVLLPSTAAGFWRRSAAFGIDMVLLSVTAGPLHLLLTMLVPGPDLAGGSSGLDAMFQIVTADLGDLLSGFAPFLLMSALYFGLFLAITGRTVGQAVMKVRVVNRHGERPSFLEAGVRLVASFLGLLPAAIGSLWMAFDLERRAFHDLVAGTYVVRDS